MRCFVAIMLPEAIKDYVEECRESLSALKLPVKWVARENYHLTVKFLGNLEQDRIARVSKTLAGCARDGQPFQLFAENLGCFPGWHKPRVLWLGMGGQTDRALDLLYNVDHALAASGFANEEHRLHLTLGRVRQGQEKTAGLLLNSGQSVPGKPGRSCSFDIDALYLMESRLGPGGPSYYIMKKYQLQGRGEQG